MACIVKLKNNCFIEWNKASDSPASKIMDTEKLKEYLTLVANVERYVKGEMPPIPIEKISPRVEELLLHIETYGTSDLGKSVDLDFILKYNRAGENEATLSLEEIISKFS